MTSSNTPEGQPEEKLRRRNEPLVGRFRYASFPSSHSGGVQCQRRRCRTWTSLSSSISGRQRLRSLRCVAVGGGPASHPLDLFVQMPRLFTNCEVLEARAHAGSTHWSGTERCIGPELGGNRTMREPTFKPKGRQSAVQLWPGRASLTRRCVDAVFKFLRQPISAARHPIRVLISWYDQQLDLWRISQSIDLLFYHPIVTRVARQCPGLGCFILVV